MSSRWLIVAVTIGELFVAASPSRAQYNYNNGGYGRNRGGGGGGMNGWSPGGILGGMGQFNQLNSQSTTNYQQAYSMSLDNRLKKEQTYFQMRRENASARAEMAATRPHYTPEQYAADNQARIAGRLSPSEWDPGRGVFVWPQSLARDAFGNDRTQIEALFGARDADPSAAGLGTANYREIKQAVMGMSDHLHAQIKEMSPDEYIPASKFLKSLEYEARFGPGTELASGKQG